MAAKRVTCAFCKRTASLDKAIAAAWEPYFWDGKEQSDTPCCPACAKKYLCWGKNKNMMEKRPEPAA
jgi:hypothetical protein